MTVGSRGTALVVGGQGFLGRHIVTALAGAGYDVTSTVRSGSGGLAVDLLDSPARALRAAVDATRPDIVINCAGTVSGTGQQLTDGNVVAPLRLLTAVASTARPPRFVHLGSAAEYGSAVVDRPVAEDDDPQPLGAYGFAKLAGTRAVLALAADAEVTATVLRVFNPVGAGAPASTLPGRLAHLLRSAAGDTELTVGPLDALRDFVDVRDVAAAVVACARAASPGPLYNVGSGRATASRELARELVGIAGFRGTIHEAAPPSDRSGGLASQQADIDRAARELSWSPQHDLSASLLDLWRCAP